jgi:hypothetical protein
MMIVALVQPPIYDRRSGEKQFTREYTSLLHRFHNFGEDVFTWLRDNKGSGEVDFAEVDGPSGKFAIRGIRAHKSRSLLTRLDEEAARQHLTLTLELHDDEQGQHRANG